MPQDETPCAAGAGKSITMEAKVENIGAITAFIDGELEKLECPFRQQAQIDVAIDELVGNIAHYAYPHTAGDVTVRFEYETQSQTVVMTFIDSGTPYNPLENDAPDVTLPVEKRKIGGLGIFLVRKTMDDVAYRHENGKNILCVRKRLHSTA